MRLIVVIGCLLCWKSAVVFAQTDGTPKRTVHELGVIVQGIPSFGLDYKVGTDKSLWRFSALTGDLSYSVVPMRQNPFFNSISLKVGHEWRKALWDNFFVAYGFDIEGGYSHFVFEDPSTSLNTLTTQRLTTSLNFVLGIHYIYKDRVNFSLNWLPNVYYQYSKHHEIFDTGVPPSGFSGENHLGGYAAGFSNLRLVVAYRFFVTKNKS